MAYDSITSWQIEGGKVETVTDFTFLGSQITADNDCKKTHAPWKRHHFANKGPYSQSYVFPGSCVRM